MAALWPLSRAQEFDANGDPLVGAKAIFFNSGTTTPQTTYDDAALSQVSTADEDGYVLTDANGRWPAVYLNPTPGSYRQRVLDPDDVVLYDDDDIDVPQAADFTPPEAGETSTELLFGTGYILSRYGVGTLAGFVRMAGRTIGSASSGATERANADCEDLFLFLWTEDANLSVSTGRGANAAADWAANKTIALPDARSRALVGLADMGNTALTIIAASLLDGGATATTLGGKGGVDDVILDATMIPAHTHSDGSLVAANHGHPFRTTGAGVDLTDLAGGLMVDDDAARTNRTAFTGTPSDTIGEQIGGSGTLDVSGSTGSIGSGLAHNNLQPSLLVTYYIKL